MSFYATEILRTNGEQLLKPKRQSTSLLRNLLEAMGWVERSFKMAGNWRVTSCNGGKGGFLFTEWQRGKEHLIVPGIGQREKVVEKRISL